MEMDYLHPNYTLTFDASFFFHGIVGVLASNVLIGLPANIYVVWMIASESSSPVVSELFALNLAIAEILFSCSSFYVMVHFLLEMPWLIGVLVMKVFLQLMLVSRPLFQTCICLERYVAVVHPTLFIRLKPLRYRLGVCLFDWLLILLDFMLPLYGLSEATNAWIFIGKSLLFLAVLSYCGLRVLLVLKQPGPGDGSKGTENWNTMKRKAFKVIIITLGFNSITQLLQSIMLGPSVLVASMLVLLQLTLFSVCISIISSFITPLLYLHRAGKLPCIEF
ncbi:PREDICTED: G-protein coupled receptor 183-like [Cyprinodon variegatus]|uniref:G-protein coupled receptor 183-like n=1 Tax=Cyprinodon variegatus TaxID=28743 RepID=UPI000742534A|nr:PREDICTED: G-protein coupled receptor 183-like [Cyprinodon variegatus]